MVEERKHVFIIGSKGIPASYGGFETFVQELVRRRKSDRIAYHVACSLDEAQLMKSQRVFYFNGTQCFVIPMWTIGAAKAILYDIEALKYCVYYIRKEHIPDAVVYILACRIGPAMRYYTKILHSLGAKVYLNPDGHEWKRAKWKSYVKAYWKFSERLMCREADYIVCDSINIEKYIRETYASCSPSTGFIAYGAEIPDMASPETADGFARAREWLNQRGLEQGKYYLIVGRFVPENNYGIMLREFMRHKTDKKLLVITNHEQSSFYQTLLGQTHFDQDDRIVFPGTVYDGPLLTGIRKMAFAYLHGHSVGGTNPSLLEALAATDLNLLYDVPFNREVGAEAALYWGDEEGDLQNLMEKAENMSQEEIKKMGAAARAVIRKRYSWSGIVEQYEQLFLDA